MGDIMGRRIEVFLTQQQLDKLSRKKIGQGKEGKVYRASNGLLFKIYYKIDPHEREEIVHLSLREYVEDEDNVKRVLEDSNIRIDVEKAIELKPFDVDKDGVKKVYSIDQIDEATKRQPKIKNTSLPLGPIFIDNKYGGVVLKEHKGYYNLHIISILPNKLRLKILKKVLENLKELCDNYIYPIDFANQDDANYPHSNILLNIFGKVEFIDLEGKTTVYTKEEHEYFKNFSYREFYFLFLDIMYGERLPKDCETEEDIFEFEQVLLKKGVLNEYIKYLWSDYDINYETCKKLIYSYMK
jgi:hypothetical protein